MFLTAEEVERFTGYKRPGKQIEWLKGYGIRFFVAADGYPRVTRTAVEGSPQPQKAKPNLDAIRKAG